MSFKNQNFCHVASNNRNNTKIGMFVYRTTDDLATVCTSGYFNEKLIDLKLHDIIIHEQIDATDNTKVKQNFLCVTQKTLSNITVKIMDTDEVDGANTDLSNLSSTGKANISAQGTYDSTETYDAGTVGAAISAKTNIDLDNLTETGANIGNWSSNVTNCITEIPQDIKLEISASGSLILKAGSKVYIPDGANTYTPVTISGDHELMVTVSDNAIKMLTVDANGDFGWRHDLNQCFSGTTAPSGHTNMLWYDTANNVIKRTTDGGSTWSGKYCLPLCIAQRTSTTCIIKQVFNGFGFIGSCVYVLPGVKGIAPNGRNADGTLKNESCVISSVQKFADANDPKGYTIGIQPNGGYTSFYGREYIQEEYPGTDYTPYKCWYKPSENKVYNAMTGQGTEIQKVCAVALYVNTTTYTLEPKTAFHAVDYGDTVYMAHQGLPSKSYLDRTLPTSGNTYTAPADGYLTVAKSATAAGQYINFVNGSNGMNCNAIAPSALPLRLYMPVSQGDIITINYDAAGTTSMFRFIFANGTK